MPLLVIMGHTALGTSFYIAFAFLESEEEEDFVWVLEMLKALYRHLGLSDPTVVVIDRDLALMNAIARVFALAVILLCIWHINMNVLKNCKADFDTEEEWKEFYNAWREVVQASHEDKYKTAWRSFKRAYKQDHQELIDYLKDTWLKPHRQHFCKAWTNRLLHFDTLTTSRVEGGHRVLKAALKTSTGDLLTVVDAVEGILTRQYQAYTHQLAQDKMKVPFKLPRELMRDLIGHVSPYALSKIYDQYLLMRTAKKEKRALEPCQKIFATTMGLPCAHMINYALEETAEKKLLLEDVHPHWRFKKPASSRLTPTETFVSDPPPASNERFYETPSEHTDDSLSDLPDADDLIRGRIESPAVSSASDFGAGQSVEHRRTHGRKSEGKTSGLCQQKRDDDTSGEEGG